MSNLETDFYQAMIHIYQEAEDFDYFATRFRMMVEQHGGVETARRLLSAGNAQEGLTRLWELNRLDLSVEYHVLHPRFQELFDNNTKVEATRRLSELGYTVDEVGDLRRS